MSTEVHGLAINGGVMAEFELIREYFDWSERPSTVSVGVGDDAAVLQLPNAQELVISVDTSNAGVHFPFDTPAHAVGFKSLAVNLSDLAAMGAEPAWFTLALSLPQADKVWVSEFAKGMQELAREHNIFLIGGDTTRGPLSITIQVMGFAPPKQALLRSGAQQGDLICVSGTLGDAAAGLALMQRRLNEGCLPASDANYCIQRLFYPTPRMVLGRILRHRATACMDISDGLLADLGHLLTASRVGARLYHALIPSSAALRMLPLQERLEFALTGGDDYELLFTLPPELLDTVRQEAERHVIPITVIGEIHKNLSGCVLDYQLPNGRQGYEHFS